MEFEFWWLLAIPISFALGWFTRSLERREANRAADRPDAYLKGLNFLLNDQPDRAVDAFAEVVRIEPETIELHFALGALFRRRGETDRAIRVHRHLVERGGLREGERENALFELGQDYLKAGLIDRAEDAFNQLEGTSYAAAAGRQRLEIAQMTRDWPRVISLAQDHGGEARVIAHARCEQAQAALDAGQPAQARDLAELARAAMFEHPRPQILLAQAFAAGGDRRSALGLLETLVAASPTHLPLVVSDWLAWAEAEQGTPGLVKAIAAVEAVRDAAASPDVLVQLARARERIESPAAAIAWLRPKLAEHPSLIGLQLLLQIDDEVAARSPAAAAADGHAKDDRAAMQALLKRQSDDLSRYVCGVCGFRARRYYWQCPGCNRWDSYSPRRSDDGAGPG
ncbi:MAG: lipopolysaccharide assembly protein LapB [Lautropia sp.]